MRRGRGKGEERKRVWDESARTSRREKRKRSAFSPLRPSNNDGSQRDALAANAAARLADWCRCSLNALMQCRRSLLCRC